MSKWFYLNFFVIVLTVWKVVSRNDFPNVPLHIVIGLLGLFLIFFNWTRHAVFSTIRDTPSRARKIKFAQLSKRVLPFHRWVGTSALIVILFHAILVLNRFGFNWNHIKMWSGLLTLSVLTIVVVSGWMRRITPSYKKRLTHLWMGITMFFLIVLHILL